MNRLLKILESLRLVQIETMNNIGVLIAQMLQRHAQTMRCSNLWPSFNFFSHVTVQSLGIPCFGQVYSDHDAGRNWAMVNLSLWSVTTHSAGGEYGLAFQDKETLIEGEKNASVHGNEATLDSSLAFKSSPQHYSYSTACELLAAIFSCCSACPCFHRPTRCVVHR